LEKEYDLKAKNLVNGFIKEIEKSAAKDSIYVETKLDLKSGSIQSNFMKELYIINPEIAFLTYQKTQNALNVKIDEITKSYLKFTPQAAEHFIDFSWGFGLNPLAHGVPKLQAVPPRPLPPEFQGRCP
jgi:hypothetical protein